MQSKKNTLYQQQEQDKALKEIKVLEGFAEEVSANKLSQKVLPIGIRLDEENGEDLRERLLLHYERLD